MDNVGNIFEIILQYGCNNSYYIDDSIMILLYKLASNEKNLILNSTISLDSQKKILFSLATNRKPLKILTELCDQYKKYLLSDYIYQYIKPGNVIITKEDTICLAYLLNEDSIALLKNALAKAKDHNDHDKIHAVLHLLSLSEHASSFQLLKDYMPPGFLLITAGYFIMGGKENVDERILDRHVWLPSFYISKYPVLQGEFLKFMDNLQKNDYPDGIENYPAHGVNYYDAMSYCEWFSKRINMKVTLPTEAQWEKASRGVDERRYPWGDDFDASKANTYESGINCFTCVDKYENVGKSPFGVVDMVGNCWEWTSSIYDSYDKGSFLITSETSQKGDRVLRGGAYDFDKYGATCSNRYRCNPSNGWDTHGFRLTINL